MITAISTRSAGADPAMIHRFLKGKDELFALNVELPADPEEVLAGVTAVAPGPAGRTDCARCNGRSCPGTAT